MRRRSRWFGIAAATVVLSGFLPGVAFGDLGPDPEFNPEIYAHRTGRTGRMGRIGTALTMVTDRDLGNLKRLLTVREISPEWRGREPDMSKVKARSGSGRRRGGPPGKSNGSAGRPPYREPSRARSR